MNKYLINKFLSDEKLLKKLMEHSYFIKDLNRDPNNMKFFISKMKEIYKERPTDKINNVIDTVDIISSFIDTI